MDITPPLDLLLVRPEGLKSGAPQLYGSGGRDWGSDLPMATASCCDKTPLSAEHKDLRVSSIFLPSTSSTLPASPGAPVTGYKRMVIPTQPPLTATKKSTPKPPSSSPGPRPPQPAPPPQPVAASYATASTPSQPTFNVQVRSAQPGPQHQAPGGPQHYAPQPQPGRAGPAQVQYVPAQPKGPDFAYGPPQPGFSPAGPGGYQEPQYPGPGGYQDQQYPGPGGYQDQQYPGPGGYQEPQYPGPGQQNAWRPEPAAPAQAYQPPAPRKTFINDPPASLAPMYGDQPMGPPKTGPPGPPRQNLCSSGPPLSVNNGCVSADPPLCAPWPRSGLMSAALPDILVPGLFTVFLSAVATASGVMASPYVGVRRRPLPSSSPPLVDDPE
ncbi:unnamed protein product [Arctogadus glacialis]